MNEAHTDVAPPLRGWAVFFRQNRVWLNVLLFALTLGSAFVVGLGWGLNYKFAEEISRNPNFAPKVGMFGDAQVVILGLVYAGVLIFILLGHELGHYLTCRRYHLDATLPFFIPAPTLVGTMGAFIRIRSPITRKRQLFDVGIAGPLTGFVLSLPALVVGLSLSRVVPALPHEGTLFFGEPLLLKIIGGLLIRNVGPGFEVIPHPVAFAGWVGAFVTSMNLFPLGQLDGGHILYAFLGPRAKVIGRAVLGVFFILGIFFWIGWLVFALLVLAIGLKHPRIWDETAPMGLRRNILGVFILLVFILTFIPDPIKGYNIFSLIRQFWP